MAAYFHNIEIYRGTYILKIANGHLLEKCSSRHSRDDEMKIKDLAYIHNAE